MAPFGVAAQGMVLCAVLTLLTGCRSDAPIQPTDGNNQSKVAIWPAFTPPSTRTGDVVDDYHGNKIADPYRWLEDQDGAEVKAWSTAQNQATRAVLDAIPARARIRQRLEELWDYARRSAPSRQGEYFVWSQNDGLQNQSVIYCADQVDAVGKVLIDPNTLSSDGTVALGGMEFSQDGSLLAYSISRSGSDWREWRVRDVATGADHDDVLLWSKFSGAAWTHDNAGFFYTRYPAPEEGKKFEAVNRNPQLCYHRLGTPQTEDEVVYERPDQPNWGFNASVTDDGRYAVISIREGTDRRSRVAYLDLGNRAAGVRPLLMDFDAAYSVVGSVGNRLFVVTDKDAPRRCLWAVDLDPATGEKTLDVLIKESTDKLNSVRLVGNRLVLEYLHDAHDQVRIHALDGTFEGELDLPGIGSVGGFTGEPSDTTSWFTFTSFTSPTRVLQHDFMTGKTTEFWAPKVDFDPEPYVTRQVFFQSKDGARIPMFLVHRRDLRFDGSHPTYLYAYGGFNISLTPSFSVATLAWLEMGGVYAQPTLRGGGEYGEEWHAAGMLERKQNVFDDFISAARYLQRNEITSPEHLAIGGGSNGGLLVGACMTQEPELFGAAVPRVGVMDMLRFHKFTIGWAWVPEYGSSEDPQQFEFLRAYSPLHNIRSGTAYPPTMVMTGDHDDRVLPGHSFKFGAALQAAQAGSAPILMRIETSAGHGAGTPTSKRIDAAADVWAFLHRALGMHD